MTKTEANLRAAFAGESQARNKYDYYAKVAEKEGYNYIAKVFSSIALNEHQHAKDEFKKINGIGTTEENLQDAIEGEHYEESSMYPAFAKEADEEGNEEAAKLFRAIAKVEIEHEKRYIKLLELLKSGNVFKREIAINWKCAKCGHTHNGTQPPEQCPSCKHARNYFEPEDIQI